MSFKPKNHYTKDELIACSNGELFTKDGDGKLPSDEMLMFDEINNIDNHSGTYGKGKIQATLVDLYKMAEGDGETWSQLGEFYPEWSVEEVKLFITMLEEISEK